MRQFFAVAKSAPPARGGRPTFEQDLSSSAEQPAGSAEQPAVPLESLKDVQQWLATECKHVDSANALRLQEAVQILCRRTPRQQDIRTLQRACNWNVARVRQGNERPLPEVIEELKGKVLQAARKLQRELGESRSTESGSAEQPASSSASQVEKRSGALSTSARRSSASSSAEQPASSSAEQPA